MNASAPAASLHADDLDWHWKFFDALTAREVYSILDARSAVFVVEQNCVYRDIDGADQAAWHLAAYDPAGRLAGYLRVLLPDAQVSLHAQAHLQRFYGAFGFTPSSDVHDEDGIPHVWMTSARG